MNATINVKSLKRAEFIDITRDVQAVVAESGVQEGVCYVFVPHTTAAVTINEGADPAVLRDMVAAFDIIAPDEPFFKHAEGNSDAHVKSSMIGASLHVIISRGKLVLGTWQAIYFCEFDGPRQRKVNVKTVDG